MRTIYAVEENIVNRSSELNVTCGQSDCSLHGFPQPLTWQCPAQQLLHTESSQSLSVIQGVFAPQLELFGSQV